MVSGPSGDLLTDPYCQLYKIRTNHWDHSISSHQTNMNCFVDFCLSCEKPCKAGAAFCSEACKLAQLDNCISEAGSSTYWDTKITHHYSNTSTSGLYLPPAIDFSTYRNQPTTPTFSSARTKRRSISEQARNDLNDYATAFDQTRTLKRRISMQSNDDDKRSTTSSRS